MEKLRLIVAALGVAAALAGCVFSQNEYIENADFSLALPAFDKAAKPPQSRAAKPCGNLPQKNTDRTE